MLVEVPAKFGRSLRGDDEAKLGLPWRAMRAHAILAPKTPAKFGRSRKQRNPHLCTRTLDMPISELQKN